VVFGKERVDEGFAGWVSWKSNFNFALFFPECFIFDKRNHIESLSSEARSPNARLNGAESPASGECVKWSSVAET
jgi:hypothetical protein